MTQKEGKGKGNMSIGPRMKYGRARHILVLKKQSLTTDTLMFTTPTGPRPTKKGISTHAVTFQKNNRNF